MVRGFERKRKVKARGLVWEGRRVGGKGNGGGRGGRTGFGGHANRNGNRDQKKAGDQNPDPDFEGMRIIDTTNS